MVKHIKKMLQETGFPVAYNHFKKSVEPPYIAFTTPYSKNFNADNMIWAVVNHYAVELCTIAKEPETEKRLTDILDGHGLIWERTNEEYITDDGVYSIIFEFEEVNICE